LDNLRSIENEITSIGAEELTEKEKRIDKLTCFLFLFTPKRATKRSKGL
jgi:hypothetical protein